MYFPPKPVFQQHLRELDAHETNVQSTAVRVHKKRDGLLMIDKTGKSRYMTFGERLAYYLLKGKTELTP